MTAPVFLPNTIRLFRHYKMLAEKTFEQLPDEALFSAEGSENSIGVTVQHLSGNMKSRFTDFLTTDGEKPWRNRDDEFEVRINDRAALMQCWNEGWQVLLNTLENLHEEDLSKTVYIRNEGHSALDAILRQLAHYSYHVGQIVHSGKRFSGSRWQSLSIAKGESQSYNQEKFSAPKADRHFTEKV